MAKNLKIGALLDVYGTFLSEKQRTLTEHYYNDDLSLSEIAENEGTTRQAVRDIIHRTTVLLEKYEEICKYSENFNRLKALSIDMESNKDEIKDIIDKL